MAMINNQRQIDLQNIVKAQEAKINILKKQMAIMKEEEDQRVNAAVEIERKQIQEKQKTIAFLKKELAKAEQFSKNFTSVKEQLKDNEKQLKNQQKQNLKLTEQINKYQTKCSQLEIKLQTTLQNYEIKCQQLSHYVKKLQEEVYILQKENTVLESEIDKINRFYLSSRLQLPKRRETLLWVDNLISYMSKSEEIKACKNNEFVEIVKNAVNSMKSEVYRVISDALKSQESIQHQKQKIHQQIKEIIEESEKSCENLLEQNKEFWDSIVKQKGSQQKELISQLEKTIEDLQKKNVKVVDDLKSSIKHLQNEKKTILLGFQQLKTLNQNRQKNYRQEIALLKSTMNDLISNQQLRQKQYEIEISGFVQQIETITHRYYQKLELPINEMSKRVQIEVQNVKKQLSAIQQNVVFKKELQKFQKQIVNYLVFLNEDKQKRQLMMSYMKQSVSIIEKIAHAKVDLHKVTQSNVENLSYDIGKKQMQSQLHAIQKEDKYMKIQYELNTLKKHNNKLKEYCNSLQNVKKLPNQAEINEKIMRLQVQKEEYQLKYESIDKLLRGQIENLRRKLFASTFHEKHIEQQQILRLNTQSLKHLSETNDQIIKFMEKEQKFIDTFSKNINSLNTILIKPVQNFQLLVKQVQHLKQNQEEISISAIKEVAVSEKKFNLQQIKQRYHQILIRRNQNNAITSKYVAQLIKTLRQTLPKNNVQSVKNQIESEKKPENEKLASKNNEKNIQKRIRAIQTQRIKMRQETAIKLKHIESILKSIEYKSSKKSVNYVKIQEVINKKAQAVIECIEASENKSELEAIYKDSLNDLKSKLQQANILNQGLLKQLSFYQSIKGK